MNRKKHDDAPAPKHDEMPEGNATEAAAAIEKLEEREGPAEGTEAHANELLAARDGGDDAVKASIAANDPSKSHAASGVDNG